jgi:hypothetical protein
MLDAVFTISSYKRPQSSIITSSSISALKKAPGTSTTDTSLPSNISMVGVIRTDLSDTVGEGPGLGGLPLILPVHESVSLNCSIMFLFK